ncbi:MAG: universal stress protein [Dehalococcoidales bacterium]|nr:universal stress protein [Dehalococcoidales bacterium]
MNAQGDPCLDSIIVMLDGSHLAEAVLPLATSLAGRLDAGLVLVHVLEEAPPATIHGEPHLTTHADAEAYLALVAEVLRSRGLKVATHVHDNPQHDVARSIAEHAEELHGDLIALCAHGRGGLRGWLIGRTAQQVITKAGRPVLVVPGAPAGPYSTVARILLPVDQVGDVAAALPLARCIAKAYRAEMVLVTVVPTPETMPGEAGAANVFLPHASAEMLKWAEEDAREALARLGEDLAREGLATASEVRRGYAAHELLRAIAVHDIDLAVLATHGRAGWEGLWAGSVGPRVVASGLSPVLVVPIPRTE